MQSDADKAQFAELQYNQQVKKDLPRNFVVHLMHGMFGQTGFRLIMAPTFIPAYILMLSGGSTFVVGLAMSLQALGMTLTPLFGASIIEHRRKVLPLGFLIGGGMRACVLFIALAGFFLEGNAILYAILFFLLMLGLFQGMQGVLFNVLMAKVIPVSKRGRLTGLRNFLAGITSAGVAYVGGTYLIGDTPDAMGYSWTFLLAFVLTSIGLLMLLATKEPEPPIVNPKMGMQQRIKGIPALLKEDPSFLRYVIARSLATMGRMAMPFYILYAGQSIGLTGETLAIITIAFTLSGTVSNLVWGVIADKHGFRITFLASILLWILSTLVLMLVDGLFVTTLVFVGIGAAVQGFQNSSQNLTLEFGEREDLPTRIAIANTASEIAGTIGPLLGGILVAILGYFSVFITSISFLILGGMVVRMYVPEPRLKFK
ncbi:MAG: MFS family permease [Candidatus Azotimanducaceae bacterium]